MLAFYVHRFRDEALETAREVVAFARGAGYKIVVCGFDPVGSELADPEAKLHDADLMLTIGGDGTLLRGARLAAPYDIPLLGINTGRLGFLTEIDGDDRAIERLKTMLESGYTLESRVALEAIMPSGQRFFALNDVVVRKGAASRIVPFGLELDGEHVAHIPSDGIIVTTPTGSTAYFLSAGGPVIAPNVDGFGIVALLPHTLFIRPLIVPVSSTIAVTSEMEEFDANLETDGDVVGTVRSGEPVTIRRYPRPVRFARLSTHSFFHRLEVKLRWGVPIQEKQR